MLCVTSSCIRAAARECNALCFVVRVVLCRCVQTLPEPPDMQQIVEIIGGFTPVFLVFRRQDPASSQHPKALTLVVAASLQTIGSTPSLLFVGLGHITAEHEDE
jgi:hypothetical protein